MVFTIFHMHFPDPIGRLPPERLVLWAGTALDAADDVIAPSGVFVSAGGGGGLCACDVRLLR